MFIARRAGPAKVGEAPMDWIGRVSVLTRRRHGWWRWPLAVALLALSIGLRTVLARWLSSTPYLIFFPELIVAALLCGWAPAAFVLAGSTVTAWVFSVPFEAPRGMSFSLAARLIGFIIVGAAEIWLITAMAALVRRLERAMQMQDALFSELQHRVANNMNIVAGMLRHTRRGLAESPARDVIDQAAARIGALAQLHRRLYDSRAYAQGLEPVLRDVLTEAFRDLPVTIRLDIGRRTLTMDQMTAITLLVNEAALNAVKHVFRAELGSVFEVTLAELPGSRLALTMNDDGPGLGPVPPAGGATQRLGMNIMRAFAEQLGGTLETLEGPGARLRVEFG
jgi:two-component sensor histidine kinase